MQSHLGRGEPEEEIRVAELVDGDEPRERYPALVVQRRQGRGERLVDEHRARPPALVNLALRYVLGQHDGVARGAAEHRVVEDGLGRLGELEQAAGRGDGGHLGERGETPDKQVRGEHDGEFARGTGHPTP